MPIGFYDILKDIIVPSAVVFLTIWYSIKISKDAIEDEKNAERRKIIDEQLSILRLVDKSIPLMIRNLEEMIKNCEKAIDSFNIDHKDSKPFFKGNSTIFLSFQSLGYHKLFEVFENHANTKESKFLDFWETSNNVPNIYSHIEEYMVMVTERYDRQSTLLNDRNTLIAIACSNIIHSQFEPYSTYQISLAEMQSNSDKRLALEVMHSINKFNAPSELSTLRRIKNFLQSLSALRTTPITAKALDSKFAQDVVDALQIVLGIETVFETAISSFQNASATFSKFIGNLREIKNITEKALNNTEN